MRPLATFFSVFDCVRSNNVLTFYKTNITYWWWEYPFIDAPSAEEIKRTKLLHLNIIITVETTAEN